MLLLHICSYKMAYYQGQQAMGMQQQQYNQQGNLIKIGLFHFKFIWYTV